MNASVAAAAPPLAPPAEFKPIKPAVDDGWNDLACASFWQWRENPAEWPDPSFPCLAPDWEHVDPSATNQFTLGCTIPGWPHDQVIRYWAAQCDRFHRTDAGWTMLTSAERLRHRSSDLCPPNKWTPCCNSCAGIALPPQPSIGARDELLIRFLPLTNAKPIRVSLRAKTRVLVTGRLEVSNCDFTSATATVHARAVFKPGIWSAEILDEMELENQGVLGATVDQSLTSPGPVLSDGWGASVGGGGSYAIGFSRQSSTPPAGYVATLSHPRDMNFYAKWCISAPPSGSVAEFIASVDLEADTRVTQNAAYEARANSEVETVVLEFMRESLHTGETPCASCTGSQPAYGPADFPGGGGAGE